MPDKLTFEIDGVEEVLGKLKILERDIRYKGGRFALRKAANLVRDAVRANALGIDNPKTAEQIAKNVAVRWSSKFFGRTSDLKFRVGILGGAQTFHKGPDNIRKGRAGKFYSGSGPLIRTTKNAPGGDTFHWRFLEFGTEHSGAKPFFISGLSENAGRATQEFVTQYGKALDRALKRAAKARG